MSSIASLSNAIEPFIDIPFNSWLTLILAFAYVCAIRSPRLLLLAVLGASTAIALFDKTSTTVQMIKVVALLPLGLGSVLAYQTMGRSFKIRHLSTFTAYINFAVYGNIVMMLGTPPGGTLRGLCSKVACLALFIWVVQQGYRVGFKTVRLHDNLFVFTAVSKSWIFAHAIYRFILLTLPCFGSGRRHRLMEFYSLGLTSALSLATGLPFEHCFGMADTLTAPAAAGWSAIATTFDLIPRDTRKNEDLVAKTLGADGDLYLSGVLLAVAAFACYKIGTGRR
ncbi:unnamed protein product [Clonostachys rhizophaga]|uniref:Uncharacterized protein n=1 Tax=Clonostachys rhizophaga TaxID=160324 RepID=A0A9N9VRN8_9HYPO|nr:unnamed protein product [Clonostachys rhizophaga]